MTALLSFICACGHAFASREWISWDGVADATCPRCGREASREIPPSQVSAYVLR